MQYRCPVGLGPSSNKCPRCAPHWKRTWPKKMKMKWYKIYTQATLLYFFAKDATLDLHVYGHCHVISKTSSNNLSLQSLPDFFSSINYSLNNHHIKKVKPILDSVNNNPDCPWVLFISASGTCTVQWFLLTSIKWQVYTQHNFFLFLHFNIFTSHFLGIEGLNLAFESWPLSYSILQHTKELQVTNSQLTNGKYPKTADMTKLWRSLFCGHLMSAIPNPETLHSTETKRNVWENIFTQAKCHGE